MGIGPASRGRMLKGGAIEMVPDIGDSCPLGCRREAASRGRMLKGEAIKMGPDIGDSCPLGCRMGWE